MSSGVAIVNQPGVLLYDANGNALVSTDDGGVRKLEVISKHRNTSNTLVDPATEATLATRASETTLASRASEATVATLATETKLEAVRVLLASLDGKDYATETKLEAVRVLLASLDGKDFATQTTLASLESKAATETTLASLEGKDFATQSTLETIATQATAAAIQTILTAIRDTAGIADLQKWLGSAAPTVGQKAMLASLPVTLASDQPAIPTTSGTAIGTGSVAAFLENGGSSDLVVDGSGTPVKFSFGADATDDIQLTSLRFVVSVGGSFDFDGNSFAEGAALANGISIDLVANGGNFDQNITTITINEDFARLLDFQPFSDIDAVITASLPFGGNVILEAGSSDEISVTINDNIALGARGVDYFTATLYGVVL